MLYPKVPLVMVVYQILLNVVDDVHQSFDLDLDEHIDLLHPDVDQLVVLKI